MSDDEVPPGAGDEAGDEADQEPWNIDVVDWIHVVGAREFVTHLHSVRTGQAKFDPMPAQAMLAMREFALHREVGDLVECARLFHRYGDAFEALATAALRRTPQEAAELVITQLRNGGGAPDGAQGPNGPTAPTGRAAALARDVVHDIAGQRAALDIAVFIWACKKAEEREREGAADGGDGAARQVINWTIQRYTSSASGRSQLDKARLYIALRYVECDQEAGKVMEGTLRDLGIDESGRPVNRVRVVEFVKALRTLSPSEPLLAQWAASQLHPVSGQLKRDYWFVRQTVAGVLHCDPERDDELAVANDELARSVGQRFEVHDVVAICRLLSAGRPDACAPIRRYAAAGEGVFRLAHLVKEWYQDPALTGTTPEFLADFVAREKAPGDGPRPLAELKYLAGALDSIGADAECERLLWRAAAVHVEGRTGGELVHLLGRITRTRHRRIAERRIAAALAGRVLEGSAGPEQFVQYIKALRDARDLDSRTAIFLARKQLADPVDVVWHHDRSAGIVARTAVGLRREHLLADAVDILERCMEDEQRMTAQDMCVIVRCLTENDFGRAPMEGLLRTTLGRWSDAGHRGETVDALQGPGFEGAVADFVRPLR